MIDKLCDIFWTLYSPRWRKYKHEKRESDKRIAAHWKEQKELSHKMLYAMVRELTIRNKGKFYGGKNIPEGSYMGIPVEYSPLFPFNDNGIK